MKVKLKKLEESLDLISNSLEDLQKRRELLLKNSRDAISLSAKAIVAMHTNDMKLAQNRLKDVRKLLRELRIIAKRDLRRYLVSPETEYVEAEVLFAIINNRPIPSRKSLSVCDSSYLLGILDAIGEVKRLILDRIREGRSEVASELFSTAENVYILISPFAAYD